MNTMLEPPPQPQHGMGCCARGCLILIAFAIFLIIAFGAGGYFALRHVSKKYLPTETSAFPNSVPANVDVADVKQRWETFQREAEAGRAASISLTEPETNALLNAYPETRGKYHVTIENDIARLQVAIPIVHIPFLSGRHLDAECLVQASADQDPRRAQIREVKLHGKPLSDEILDLQFQSKSVRGFATEFLDEYHVTRFGIADGKISAACEPHDASD